MNTVYDQFRANVQRLFVKPQDKTGRMVHAALGLNTEAGEIGTDIKAKWIYGREIDLDAVLYEAGDCLFYLDAILCELGFTLEDAMVANIAKLKMRYPNGYSDEAANSRKDEAGR